MVPRRPHQRRRCLLKQNNQNDQNDPSSQPLLDLHLDRMLARQAVYRTPVALQPLGPLVWELERLAQVSVHKERNSEQTVSMDLLLALARVQDSVSLELETTLALAVDSVQVSAILVSVQVTVQLVSSGPAVELVDSVMDSARAWAWVLVPEQADLVAELELVDSALERVLVLEQAD